MAAHIENVTAGTAPAPEEILSPDGFNFNGVTRTKRRISYYIKEVDLDVARSALEAAGIQLEHIAPRKVFRLKRRRKPKRADFAAMAEQMAEQLDAGVPITQVCEVLGRTTNNEILAESILGAGELIRQGRTMPDAFSLQVDEKEQQIFPITFINALRIGDEGGETGTMLKVFAEAQIKADNIMGRIRSASVYPLVVLAVAFVLALAFMYFVMPKIAEFYEAIVPPGDNDGLPIPTRVMIWFSGFLWSVPGIIAFFLAVAGIIVFVKWIRSAKGKEWMARHNIHWPIVGELLRHYHASIILRNISMLAKSGATMGVMLPQASQSSTNPVYSEMLDDVYEFVLDESTDLATAFAPYGYLMGDEFKSVLITREKTGNTEELFAKYAQVLETRVDRYVERATKLIEPLLICGVACFIALFVLAVYMPLFQMIGKLANHH